MKTFATASLVTLVAALLSTGPMLASAGCFTSGEAYANKDAARSHVSNACYGYDGKRGAFEGHYAPGEIKNACVEVTPNQRIDMSVRNLNSREGFSLKNYDCSFRLAREIDACDRGSETEFAGWQFR